MHANGYLKFLLNFEQDMRECAVGDGRCSFELYEAAITFRAACPLDNQRMEGENNTLQVETKRAPHMRKALASARMRLQSAEAPLQAHECAGLHSGVVAFKSSEQASQRWAVPIVQPVDLPKNQRRRIDECIVAGVPITAQIAAARQCGGRTVYGLMLPPGEEEDLGSTISAQACHWFLEAKSYYSAVRCVVVDVEEQAGKLIIPRMPTVKLLARIVGDVVDQHRVESRDGPLRIMLVRYTLRWPCSRCNVDLVLTSRQECAGHG